MSAYTSHDQGHLMVTVYISGALTSVNHLVNFSSCREQSRDGDTAPLLHESVSPDPRVGDVIILVLLLHSRN